MEEKPQQIEIPKAKEFSIQNLEIVRTANFLDLKYDDLTEKQVSDKMETIWKNWEEQKTDKSFFEYIRGLNSKLGYRAGIHPLDKIYTYLTIQKQEKRKEKIREKEKAKKLLIKKKEEEKLALLKEIELKKQKEEEEKRKLSLRRAKMRIEKEKELFKQKIKTIKQILEKL